MEKSISRTITNVQTPSDSRKPIVDASRAVSSEVNRDKSEICSSAKEKTPDLTSQSNVPRNFADFMKFGPIYGPVPSQYFDQFSGLPMQHPSLYVGAMFPPMAALPPEAHFPYYPYMYPPPGPFTIANPHVYGEPAIAATGKRERTGTDIDRKEYRDTDSETRDRNESSSKKDGSPKTWRTEPPETMRKESVIKSVVKETTESGKTSNELRTNRDNRTNYVDQRSVKLDYQRKDDREGMVSNSIGKFPIGRSEERSPPILSRGHDVTTRPSETCHQSFVPSPSVRGKNVDNPQYTNGTPGYSYLSPRKAYDPTSSHRRDARLHDVDRRGFLDTSKDDARVMMDKSRVNGLKESPEKARDIEETKSRNSNDGEDSPYMKFQRRGDRYDDREDKRLRYSEEQMNRRARRDEAMRRNRRREESERDRSPPLNLYETSDRVKSNFPVTTAHSVETIMNGRPSTSPTKSSERPAEETRSRNEWVARMNDRVPENVDPKRMEVVSRDDLSREQRVLSRGQQSHEDREVRGQQSREVEERSRDHNFVSREREQRSRDQSSGKDDLKIVERERIRYEAAVNEPLRTGRPYFGPRFMNPGMLDHREIDSRLYAPGSNLRGFDPKKHDLRTRDSVDVKSKRNLDEQNDEKHRSEERISRRNESPNDRPLPEHLRAFQNDDGRPRSAPQCSTRSASPRMNGADAKFSRTEVKARGLDTAGQTEILEGKQNETGNTIGQLMPSKTRSPLKDDDVVVSKSDAGNESSRTVNSSRPGTDSSMSNAMRTGLGNMVMTPAGAGYPSLPMLNSDAYFQQLLMAQSEGRLPMFLPMPNGMFSPAVVDPNHAALLSNEYMMKACRELLQDPRFELLNQQRIMYEKALLTGKDFMGYPPHAMTAEGQQEVLKNLSSSPQLIEMQKRQQQQQQQQQLLQQQQQQQQQQQVKPDKLDTRRAKDAEQEQTVKSEEVDVKQLQEKRDQEEAAKRRKEEEERQSYIKSLLLQKDPGLRQQQASQPNEQQIPKSVNSEPKQTQSQEGQQSKLLTQQFVKQQQISKQWQHQRDHEILQQQKQAKEPQQTQKQQLLQQQNFLKQQKDDEQRLQQQNLLMQKRQSEKLKLLEQQQQQLQIRVMQSEKLKMQEQQQQQQQQQQQKRLMQRWQQQQSRQDVLQNERPHEEQEQRKNLSEQAVSYDNSTMRAVDGFKEQTIKDEISSGPTEIHKVNPATQPLVKEEQNRFQFPEPKLAQDMQLRRMLPVVSEPPPTVAEVGPTSSDVGELSPTCVSAAEVLSRFRSSGSLRFLDKGEEGTKEPETDLPTPEASLSTSSTPQGDGRRFSFYDNPDQNEEYLENSSIKLEPVMPVGNQEQKRCRGNLSELVQAVQEQLGAHGEIGDQNPGGDLISELYTETEEDLLSDGCDAGELSPLSDYGDNDCWWWITRSPCVPSARRIPQYLEDKENIFAQIRRNEKNRQNICENINRLRKEAKRGLTKATKERYAALANNKLILDAESVLNSACTNIKAATEIDGLQETLRDQLLSIQRTYRERHRELARLTPKNKDKHEDSPVKRGPGRPRKRKNCSNSKPNVSNEPDASAANSPTADQMETRSPAREEHPDPVDDVDEGGEVEEAKCEPDPPCSPEENPIEDIRKLETAETPKETEVHVPVAENVWPELAEQTYEAEPDEHPDETEVVSKKKQKKKRRRITSDSDPEIAPRASETSDKPKKAKKAKKASKSKSSEVEGEGKKKSKTKQGDDDVFTSDNGEQGLNLLARYSTATCSSNVEEKVSPKKRKRSTVSDETSAASKRSQKPSKLNLKSPPKDDSESTSVDTPTKPTEQRPKDPEQVTKKGQAEYPETFEKSSEKSNKTKAATSCLANNDDFFPRRSERIFLSSSSSLASPTTTSGGFEIPTVNKKKAKAPSGKIIKKKDQEHAEQETAIEESIEKETNCETSKKKKKVKIKQQEEKKKKKLKSKRKGSLGECTDEEYDEQTFVEEIKQLPKRNRHAPRRYIEYDSGEEKMENDASANEQQAEDEENAESESEKTGAEYDVVTKTPEQEHSEHEPSEVESETADHSGDIRQDEDLDTNVVESVIEDNEEDEKKVNEEKETTSDKKMEDEDGEVDNKETEEAVEVANEENEKGKAPFPWMLSMSELCKGLKMLLPVEGVYYPGRIEDIHVPDLYAIILDGERGRRPHHYCSSEQLLTEAVKDIQPDSLDDIPIGTRVCAYWSQQYRCFYPGLVSEVPEDEKIARNCCWVEFDDGDSGEFPLQDVRLIPPDFPQEGTDCESNSGLPEPSRPKKSEQRTGDEGIEEDLASDSGDSTVENGHERTRDKRRRDKKEYSKTRRTDDDEYERSKTMKYRLLSDDLKSSRSERSNSKRKIKSDSVKDYTKEERDTREDEGEMEWMGDVFADEGSLRRKRFTKYSPTRPGGGEEPEVLVFPPDRIWRWAGKPCPNRRKRGGRKVFYKSIYRGDEHISVGECAVFLSSPSKNPHLPYVGKIIKMWERFNGSKVVRVKWFYHPEETKAGLRPSDGKNGLYLSSHVDENDVQTIAHKCEVVQVQDPKSNRKSTNVSDSDVTNNNIFWCLGTYDPLTETFPSDNE